jgi:hypothetical protein
MQDIIPPTREEALAPVPRAPARKRRSGRILLALACALGLGLTGGLQAHRFVNLDEAAAWASQRLRSGIAWTRTEVAGRLESLMTGSAGNPSSMAGAARPAAWKEPTGGDLVDRLISDLSGRVDQVRVANESSARDIGQGLERLRISADQNQREVIGNLAQLGERLERIERHSMAATAPDSPRPIAQSPGPPPARPAIKTASKAARTPVPAAKVTTRPPPSEDPNTGPDDRRLPSWTVLDVFEGTAVLNGPRGLVEVSLGDSIPGIGRVHAILRSGRRWIVATSKGVITAQ